MIIKLYIISALLTLSDEIWNINTPRHYSFKSYKILKWEDKDFYSQKINNEWVLKKYRANDNETKKYVRKLYWTELLKNYPKLEKLP